MTKTSLKEGGTAKVEHIRDSGVWQGTTGIANKKAM